MRENITIIQIGNNLQVSTNWCKNLLSFTKPERALIIDVYNKYNKVYPCISLDKDRIEFMKNPNVKGIYRITFDDLTHFESNHIYIDACSRFRSGLLICENPFEVFTVLPDKFLKLLIYKRQDANDVLINFKTFSGIMLPEIIRNTNYINLYKTIEPVCKYKKFLKQEKYYDLFLEAENRLNTTEMVVIDLLKRNILTNTSYVNAMLCKTSKNNKPKYTKEQILSFGSYVRNELSMNEWAGKTINQHFKDWIKKK